MGIVTQSVRRPEISFNPITWSRKNLFNTWYNSLLTLVTIWLVYKILSGLIPWILTKADWSPVTTSPILYLVGQYPAADLWRVGLGLVIVSFLFGMSWGTWGGVIRTFALALVAGYMVGAVLPVGLESLGLTTRLYLVGNVAVTVIGFALGRTRLGRPRWVLFGWALSFIVIVVLLRGFGGTAWLEVVSTGVWGGLMLNLLLAVVGIAASFPLGVLLALGRRSSLTVIRLFSTLFIEGVRGVPLISILFMGSIILPLFLPEGVRIDRVVRALIGITLFSAAYMAENVRGGLQAVPEGQYEAAKAIGLSGPLTTLLIILPQALRLVIPAIVGQFISLFKDTTLVAIIGLIEILGIGKSIVLGNPEWVDAQAEVYLFIGAVFWVFTYAMSYGSRRLEKALGVGER
jgi:general L-amino acid transport system permease protein